MEDKDLAMMLGKMQGRLDSIETICRENRDDNKAVEKRLSRLEISNAKQGAVAGGIMATAVTLVSATVKYMMNGGST